MRRFKNVLFVPAMPSETTESFDLAMALARANDAKLTLHAVMGDAPELQHFVQLGSPPESVPAILARGMASTLQAVADRYDHRSDGAEVQVQVAVDIGRAAVSIVRRAMASDHDLVILTTDGSDDREALIRVVLRTCPKPVWVMRQRARNARVLAAVDPAGETALNHQILELANDLATDSEGELHIVHAWQLFGEESLLAEGASLGINSAEVAEFAGLVEASHRQQLEKLLADLGYDQARNVHMVNCDPGTAIKELINMYRIDLLVMGSIGRTGDDGAVVGNTAEQVFDEVPSSVLVVKPPGFVSPIRLAG